MVQVDSCASFLITGLRSQRSKPLCMDGQSSPLTQQLHPYFFFSLPVEVIQTKNASCSSLPDRVVYVSCRIRVNPECNSSTQSCFFVQVRGRICRICHYAKSAKDDGAHMLFPAPLEPCILVATLVL